MQYMKTSDSAHRPSFPGLVSCPTTGAANAAAAAASAEAAGVVLAADGRKASQQSY